MTSDRDREQLDALGVPGVSHEWIGANGTEIHVASAGAGRPLVLLHGWPQHWYAWRHLIGPLAEHRHVICPDLRGFGWSRAPGHGYDPGTFAADVVSVMDSLEIDRADFAGHDWGGYVGFLIALEAPERLDRLLALNIVPPFARLRARQLLALWRFWYQWMIAAPLIGRFAIRHGIRHGPISAWFGAGNDVWNDDESRAFSERLQQPERVAATQSLYRHALFREPLMALRRGSAGVRLEVPTRILFGTADRAISPVLLAGCDEGRPALALDLVDGVGHQIIDERPDLVLDRMRELFEIPTS